MLLGHLRKLNTNVTLRLPAKIEGQDALEEEEDMPGEELQRVQFVHVGFKRFSIHQHQQHGCVMLLALKLHYTTMEDIKKQHYTIPSHSCDYNSAHKVGHLDIFGLSHLYSSVCTPTCDTSSNTD